MIGRGRRLPASGHGLRTALVLLAAALGAGVALTAAALPPRPPGGPSDRACLRCHADPALRRAAPGASERQIYVDPAALARSTHSRIGCTACHRDVARLPHAGRPGPASCDACHPREAAAYAGSIHGRGLAKADPDVPRCQRCHGGHDIRPAGDPRSPIQPLLQARICMDCHANSRMASRHSAMPNVLAIRAYTDSVHGRAVARSGLGVAPSCTGCHGTHDLQPADDPASPVHRSRLAETCGRCHQGILAQYRESIHGRALARGVAEAPTCTSCHGEHTIARPEDPASRVAARNIAKTCGSCHASERLARAYGLPTKRVTTYADSFHGIAVKFGNRDAANCASCHGFHDIRPSSDAESRVAKANLPRTCGECHPGAGPRFAEGRVHLEKTRESAAGVFYVRTFYAWFIGALMVGFVGYMGVEVYGHLRRRRARWDA